MGRRVKTGSRIPAITCSARIGLQANAVRRARQMHEPCGSSAALESLRASIGLNLTRLQTEILIGMYLGIKRAFSLLFGLPAAEKAVNTLVRRKFDAFTVYFDLEAPSNISLSTNHRPKTQLPI